MNKAELLETIRQSRARLDHALSRLSEAQLTQVNSCGAWSVKDIIAHISWHEKEILQMLASHVLAGSPWWGLPTHERNDQIFLANKDRPLEDVQQEARQSFPALLAALEALPEEDLTDPARFADMPADWQPVQLVIENTYEHYDDHLKDLQAAFPQ